MVHRGAEYSDTFEISVFTVEYLSGNLTTFNVDTFSFISNEYLYSFPGVSLVGNWRIDMLVP